MVYKTKFRLPHEDKTRSSSQRKRTEYLREARKFKRQMQTT